MNLPRHSISSHALKPLFVHAQFAFVSPEGQTEGTERQEARQQYPIDLSDDEPDKQGRCMLACATNDGFFVARTDPAEMVLKRQYSSLQGGLSHALLIDDSSLVVLVGGGRVPRYAPNKVVIWDEQATRIAKGEDPNDDDINLTPSKSGTQATRQADLEHQSTHEEEARIAVPSSPNSMLSAADKIPSLNADARMGDQTIDLTVRLDEATEVKKPDSPNVIIANEDLAAAGVADMASSMLARSVTGSLVSSTANLADPFNADDNTAKFADQGVNDPIFSEADSSNALPPRRDDPYDESRVAREPIRKGSEVAELEFSEMVQAVNVRSLAVTVQDGSVTKSALLVVQLQTKALIFEMGSALTENGLRNPTEGRQQPWGIRQRAVLEIDANSSRCVPSIALVHGTQIALVALVGRQSGLVQLVTVPLFDPTSRSSKSTNVSVAGASVIFAAHANAIRCITLSQRGDFLCTASERGTLIRLWSTSMTSNAPSSSSTQGKMSSRASAKSLNITLLAELRRGTDAAHILSMVFSPDDCLLAAASEKGTIHFFDLRACRSPSTSTSAAARDSRSFQLSRQAEKYLPSALHSFAQSIPASVLPQYFTSQWSVCQFKIQLKTFSGRTSNPMRHVRAPTVQPSQQRHVDQNEERADKATPAPPPLSVGDVFVPRNDRNLEGGWATMRGRVSDIRRGERSIAESVWLTFVPSHAASLVRSEQSGKQARRTTKTRAHNAKKDVNVGDKVDLQTTDDGLSSSFHLLAVTSSGSLYRLAVSENDALHRRHSATSHVGDSASAKSTVLNMYKGNDEREKDYHTRQRQQKSCQLVEHIHLTVMEDDWNI